MRKLFFFFVLLLMVGFTAKAAGDIVFKASAPSAVAMGEQFRLTYTVNAEAKDLRVQPMPDFEVLMGPSQSVSHSSSWVNGQSKSETTVSFTYILMPKKEGTFEIAPATVKANGANYTSNALTIKVLPEDKTSKNRTSGDAGSASSIGKDDFFVRMEVSDRSVYEQEGFLVTFKLYAARPCNLSGAKFPDFAGFLAQEVELPEQKQWEKDNYNGRNYFTVVLKQTVLYPQRSGKITISPAEIDAVIPVATQRKVRSIFDDFFDAYQEVNKKLTTASATVDVKPLPSGKPASFSGAVGNFTMSSTINTNSLKANEAVTVTVKISGNGNLKLVKNPEVKFPNDFDIYDPKVEIDSKTTVSGVSGTKTVEYMAIPRYAGDFEIPAIEFSYFDTKSGSYKTVKSEPYKLHVEKGEGGDATAPVVSNFSTNRESVKFLGKDIRYLKTKGFHFTKKGEDVFFGSFMYTLCYLIPLVLFAIFFVIYRKQIKENADLARVRNKKANKIAVKRLKSAGKLMAEGKKEEFYEEVLRALWGYLSDKLNISKAELTKDNVEAELAKYGVDEVLIKDFIEILNTCEFARYAPSQAPDAMDKLYGQTVDAIGKMENTIKK